MGKHRYTVTVTATDGSYQESVARVLAGDHGQAAATAVDRLFGWDCWILWDRSMDGHGQIFRAVSDRLGSGNAAVTGRVRIDIREGWERKEVEQ